MQSYDKEKIEQNLCFNRTEGPWKFDKLDPDKKQQTLVSTENPIAQIAFHNLKNLHGDSALIAAAPQLYEALKELLASIEEGLMTKDLGCECERCTQAKQQAYQALGFAEGRAHLKESEFFEKLL